MTHSDKIRVVNFLTNVAGDAKKRLEVIRAAQPNPKTEVKDMTPEYLASCVERLPNIFLPTELADERSAILRIVKPFGLRGRARP